MGDTVNVASRLEGLNKDRHHHPGQRRSAGRVWSGVSVPRPRPCARQGPPGCHPRLRAARL